MNNLRILLVDDHELVRMGLHTLLDGIDGVQVIGEAGSANEAFTIVEAQQPDVVIMDIRMPNTDGIEATRTITTRWPKIQVIMLTSFADDELIARAIQAGAVGYVLKQVGSNELLRALEAVRHGAALLDPSVTRRVLAMMRQKPETPEDAFEQLTEREITVLRELANGKSNNQIADALYLSEKTVRNQVSIILDKLHLNNRVEAATFAVQHSIQSYKRGS
jgi:two-component system, NarL family, response regulator DevR